MISLLLVMLVGILVIAVIIAANGYFVAQEFAYMSVDRSALRAGAEQGDAASRRALKVTKRTSFMLSGAQLGITVTGILVGNVAEPFVGEPLGVLLSETGLSLGTAIGIATVITLGVATVTQMIFAELFPKNLAIANPLPLARALSRSTLIYLASFGWLIAVFDRASNALLRLVRVEPVHDLDISANADDLSHIVEESRNSGDLPPHLSLLIDRILDFPKRDVEHAMISRAQVDVFSADLAIRDARVRMAGAHTRYPVLDDTDTPVGVVHLVDILACDPNDEQSIETIMRPPAVVSALMRLPDALELMYRGKHELVCVIDEYGGFAGILTLEDLAEELVGELTDEHDSEGLGVMMTLPDGSWRVPGSIPLDEVEREFGRELPPGDYETFAGLVIAQHGSLPERGETLEIELPATPEQLLDDEHPREALRVTVEAVKKFVPSSLRVQVISLEREPESSATDSEPHS